MTNQQKIDILYSKYNLVDQASESVFNDQIWRDGSEIPSVAPEFSEDGYYYNAKGKKILQKFEYVEMRRISSEKFAFTGSDVYDVVCFDGGFDVTYRLRFFNRTKEGTYIEMPYSPGDMFFDTDSGVLLFTKDLSSLYDKNRLFVSFVRYEGEKGFNVLSQFPSFPDLGPTGPTGPTGHTGATGPTKVGSLRYKGNWDPDASYGRWNVVKYDDKLYFSSVDFNDRSPDDAPFWLPFGAEQFRSSFSYPASTVFVSPAFPGIGNLVSTFEEAFDYIDSNGPIFSMIVYPGEYLLNDSIDCTPATELRITFIGHVSITFSDGSSYLAFSDNSRIEMMGGDFSFTNGKITLTKSSLQSRGGSFNDLEMTTTDTSDVSRFFLQDASVHDITCYSSQVLLERCCIRGVVEMDELSCVRLESCHATGENNGSDIVNIISADDSGVPSGFGMSNPALLVRNTRILSDGGDIVTYTGSVAPQHGLKIAFVSSSLYDVQGLASVNNYDYFVDTYLYDMSYNTSYDTTSATIVEGNIEDVNSSIPKENI